MNGAVKSALRVLDLLELMAAQEGDVGVSEAARRLGFPKSSTSMLLATLESRGYAIGNEQRRFHLHPMLAQGNGSWVGGTGFALVRLAKDAMEQLAASTRESSFLGVPRGEASFEYIAKVVTPNEVRCDGVLHKPRELHSTSVGLVILAFQPAERTERFLKRGQFARLTARTFTDAQQVRDEIALVRKRGYATVADTNSPGVAGMAAPIFDAAGNVVAALNVSAPMTRFEAMPPRTSADLVKAADAISRQLSGKATKTVRKVS